MQKEVVYCFRFTPKNKNLKPEYSRFYGEGSIEAFQRAVEYWGADTGTIDEIPSHQMPPQSTPHEKILSEVTQFLFEQGWKREGTYWYKTVDNKEYAQASATIALVVELGLKD